MSQHFLTDIEIKQFKCFTDFTASGFKRVNLIGGKNNIGKTAFMEACYVNVHGMTINNLITAIVVIKARREKPNLINKETDINILSTAFLDATRIYISSSNLNKIEYSIIEQDANKEYVFKIQDTLKTINTNSINIKIKNSKNIEYIDSFGLDNAKLNRNFGIVQKKDKEEELNKIINNFDSDIEKFKIIGDKPLCKVNNIYRDITEFGDGLKHYISIICALYACENGYLFIDEIDNGIHYTQLDRLWEIILKTSAKTNCQVFATTHSKEMLESFARVAKQLNEQDISFTTLIKNDKQEIKALTRDYEMILDSLDDGREVR
jgi:AAA15 family ATPase/GTPase